MLSGMMMIMIFAFAAPSVSRAYVQASGVITADAAKVRKEPSTQSDTISSLLKGAMVTVIDEVKDSAGALWYKVSYENSTGYVRSDLMLKATAPTTTVTTTTTTGSVATNASQPAATQVTAIAETKAYVNFKSARVRQGASTQHEIVGSAVENTPVVITGEAKGTDGKKWYQVRYTNQNGREVVGFIRSDLVTVGEPPAPAVTAPAEPPAEAPAEQPEEAPAEQPEGEGGEGGEGAGEGEGDGGEGQQIPEPEPEPEETVKPDYEMVYQANSEGVEEWYLFDNINGTQQSLENLRAAAEAGERLSLASSKQASTQKIIIIVLAVLAAVLAVIVAFLLFKLKDMYEDDDEDEEEDDEEEEEEEEEEERVIRRRRPVANMEEKTQKPAPAARTKPVKERERKPVPVKQVEYDPEDEFEAGQPAVQKQQPKRKAKNFLIEDDEFEFEFLNMDDKK